MNPESIKWAMFDRKKYYKAVEKLTQLNDYLHQTLGDYQVELLAQSTPETCLAMLRLTESVQEMKDLLEAAKIVRIPDVELNGVASVFSQATILADPAEQHGSNGTLFERLTQFSIAYAEINASRNADSRLGTRLDAQQNFHVDYEAEQDGFSPRLAKFGGRDVWIEWKEYEEVPVKEGGRSTWDASPLLVRRLDQLAALLERKDKPEEFHTPHCLGYFQDVETSMFGFIFEIPEQQQKVQPVSLLSLLRKEAPTINERVKIGYSLAMSLFCLHAVGWLHKGLRSACVLFYTAGEQVDIGKPFNIGFRIRSAGHGRYYYDKAPEQSGVVCLPPSCIPRHEPGELP